MTSTTTLSAAGHLALSLRKWGVADHDTHALLSHESRSTGFIYWIPDATKLRHDLHQAAQMLEVQDREIAGLRRVVAAHEAAQPGGPIHIHGRTYPDAQGRLASAPIGHAAAPAPPRSIPRVIAAAFRRAFRGVPEARL